MSAQSGDKTLKQQIDFLGFLSNQLKDLQGPETLAYELIQNADDAPGATQITFEIRQDMLIVTNDGVFRDEDFDRLRRISGRGKREEQETTGSFGIGFISVYQVTDQPAIRSAGRRWVLHPEREGEIDETDDRLTDHTVFELPWARNPDTKVRKEMSLQAIDDSWIQEFEETLTHILPEAGLFLRKVVCLELVRRDGSLLRVQRASDQGRTVVSRNGEEHRYTLLRSDFHTAATQLRTKYEGLLESKRTSQIVLAVPEGDRSEAGRYYAFLPTQVANPFGIHIQADFFPTQSRKSILFDPGYTGQWNLAALETAATSLSSHLLVVRDVLGPVNLWTLIDSARAAAEQHSGKPNDAFWAHVKQAASSNPVLFTSEGEWVIPDQAVLVSDPMTHADILTCLGLNAVHDDLRSHANMLRQHMGTSQLNLGLVLNALEGALAVEHLAASDWRLRDSLRAGLDLLLQELKASSARDPRLRTLPFVARADGSFGAAGDTFRAEAQAQRVLLELGLADALSAEPSGRFPGLLPDAKLALTMLLKRVPPHNWSPGAGPDGPVKGLLLWLVGHLDDVRENAELIAFLRGLPIWPVGASLATLDGVVRPGDFVDPLGLANVLDTSNLSECAGLLEILKVSKLSLDTYVLEQVPLAFEAAQQPTLAACRGLRTLLSRRLGDVRRVPGAAKTLTELAFVECTDGSTRRPREVYLPGGAAAELLDTPALVVLPDDGGATKELLGWLGVESEPRVQALVERVRAWVAKTPPRQGHALIKAVIEHLSLRFRDAQQLPQDLLPLKSLAWLPAEGAPQQWYSPGDLFLHFRRSLFASSGRFIDLSYDVQTRASQCLTLLGVQSQPPIAKVVAHLLNSIRAGHQVGQDVYQELGDHVSDPLVQRLSRVDCIWCGTPPAYHSPQQVFFRPVAFGQFGVSMEVADPRARAFFDAVGVRDQPEARDGARVLLEIAEEFESRELGHDSKAIAFACWELIGNDAGAVEIAHDLADQRVIPNRNGTLCRPTELLFEDRSLVVSRFGALLQNVAIDLYPDAVGRAMAAAGVRKLSEVLRTHLVDEVDPVFAPDLTERIRDRHDLLVRACSGQKCSTGADALLRGIQVDETDRIHVVHCLDCFGRPISTSPFEQAALLRERRLLVVRRHEDLWTTVATELASELVAPTEVAGLASILAGVLEAGDPATASRKLDHLGVPPLTAEVPEAPGSPTTRFESLAAELDTGATKPDTNPVEQPPPSTSDAGERTPSVGQELTTRADPEGDLPEDSDSVSSEEGVAPGTRPESGATGHRRLKRPGTRGVPTPDRLRSYVSRTSASGDGADGDLAQQNTEVDRLGCEAVLAFERSHGREPELMNHANKGFDVLSRDPVTSRVRYIEVKSRRGEWNLQGVALSAAQYEFLEAKRDEGWLYVVEHATTSPVIHMIPNPIGQITQYFFDDGWRAAADED